MWDLQGLECHVCPELLDELFGFTEKDTKAYEIAQQLFWLCACYLSSSTKPPEGLKLTEAEKKPPVEKKRKLVKTRYLALIKEARRGSHPNALLFHSQCRGGEGILQKTWTFVTINLCRENARVQLMGQRDNQFLSPKPQTGWCCCVDQGFQC